MEFETTLIPGTLIQRYKRFLADIQLESGEVVTAHCANSGTMLTCNAPGSSVYISPASNPRRKLAYTWEMIGIDGTWVGINTHRANGVAEEAITSGKVPELAMYSEVRREVKYGTNSRIDLLLENDRESCYVEVKSVTLSRNGWGEFPDAVTARGTKHLRELAEVRASGHRAVVLFLAQRGDVRRFRPAWDIDPEFCEALLEVSRQGVEVFVYGADATPGGTTIRAKVPHVLDMPPCGIDDAAKHAVFE